MAEKGFIRDMLDVKVLVLLVMDRVQRPLRVQQIYELCYQDDRLTYFDVCEAVPQLVESGHLLETAPGCFEITDKGRQNVGITGDAVAFTVRRRAQAAADNFNKQAQRNERIQTRIEEKPDGYVTYMELSDPNGIVFSMQIVSKDRERARKLERGFWRNAESIHCAILDDLLEEIE